MSAYRAFPNTAVAHTAVTYHRIFHRVYRTIRRCVPHAPPGPSVHARYLHSCVVLRSSRNGAGATIARRWKHLSERELSEGVRSFGVGIGTLLVVGQSSLENRPQGVCYIPSYLSSRGWVQKNKLKLPHFHASDACGLFNVTRRSRRNTNSSRCWRVRTVLASDRSNSHRAGLPAGIL